MPELVLDHADIKTLERQIIGEVLKAQKGSVQAASRWLEKEFESLTRAAVRGDRAWRVWTSQVYPKGGALAYEPTGYIWPRGGPRAEGMMEYWSMPGVNRARNRDYLTVPLDAALGTFRGRKISPREWESTFGVKLRPWFRPGKTPLLVADVATDKAGRSIGRANADAMRRGGQQITATRTIAVFALLEMQPFANRVALGPAIPRARDFMANDFGRRLSRMGQ